MSEKKTLAIVVDDGLRRVPIENKEGEEIGSFRFRPTDVGIVERYNNLVKNFDNVIEPLLELDGPDGAEIDVSDPRYVEALNEATGRLRAEINRLFDSDDAADAFFGKMNPFSPVDGAFYAGAVLEAVGTFIAQAFDAETAKLSTKVQKYAKRPGRK